MVRLTSVDYCWLLLTIVDYCWLLLTSTRGAPLDPPMNIGPDWLSESRRFHGIMIFDQCWLPLTCFELISSDSRWSLLPFICVDLCFLDCLDNLQLSWYSDYPFWPLLTLCSSCWLLLTCNCFDLAWHIRLSWLFVSFWLSWQREGEKRRGMGSYVGHKKYLRSK